MNNLGCLIHNFDFEWVVSGLYSKIIKFITISDFIILLITIVICMQFFDDGISIKLLVLCHCRALRLGILLRHGRHTLVLSVLNYKTTDCSKGTDDEENSNLGVQKICEN
jgi:hypothetical protein